MSWSTHSNEDLTADFVERFDEVNKALDEVKEALGITDTRLDKLENSNENFTFLAPPWGQSVGY